MPQHTLIIGILSVQVAKRKVLVIRDQQDFIDRAPEFYLEWGKSHTSSVRNPVGLTYWFQVATSAVCTSTPPPATPRVSHICIWCTAMRSRRSTTRPATAPLLRHGTPMSAMNANPLVLPPSSWYLHRKSEETPSSHRKCPRLSDFPRLRCRPEDTESGALSSRAS